MKTIIYSVLAMILVTSCAKDGDTGPQGPPGANGNANIKSVSFSVSPGDWSTYGTPGSANHGKYYQKSIPQITNTIMFTGMVMGYLVNNDFEGNLPVTLYPASNYHVQINGFHGVGAYEVGIYQSNLSTPNIVGTFSFRVVIADGTLRAMNPDLDWNNYQEVKKRFNFVD